MPDQQIPGVVFQPNSHRGLQRGINQLVNVVRPTLGPRPRTVAIESTSRHKTPELLDSAGVIARRIVQLHERDADMGAMMVRHLLWKLHEEVGDGTATAAVLFQTVYNRGFSYIAAGGNAMRLRRYLEQGTREIVAELERMTVSIDGKQRLALLAESLCFDQPLAMLLGEIFDLVGEYGHVEIRTGHRRELERQYVEGSYWGSKVLSPHMLTDHIKLRADLTDAAILISDLELEDPREVFPMVHMAMEAGHKALVILATKLSETVVALLLAASRDPEKFQVLAVQTPGAGASEQMAAMEDLSIMTGGRPVLKVTGDTLRKVTAEDLGHARRVWGDRFSFGIVGGKGDPRRLRAHIANLRTGFATSDDRSARNRLQQRLGRLLGGSAVLWIGGTSEPELKAREELAKRTSDMLRTALREGVVPGGGVALLACRPKLRQCLEATADADEQAAYRILLRALEEPLRTIVSNAGFDASPVVARLIQAENGSGFDARQGQVVNMAEAGIFDLAAAQKAAIQGAVTSAALALTVDILIHKKKPQATPGRP